MTGPETGAKRKDALTAVGILVGLFIIYSSNGGPLPGNDTKASAWLPVVVLDRGELTFTPDDEPFMFTWKIATADGPRRIAFDNRHWTMDVDGKTLAEHRAAGTLQVVKGKYYVRETVHDGRYAGSYGPGAGLAALPVFAAFRLAGADLSPGEAAPWVAAKAAASLFVAGSAALLFFIARRFLSASTALALVAVYALGTSAWSTSTQALWQHGPNSFFLAAAALLLLRSTEKRGALLSGLFFGLATFCRPTSLLAALPVGADLFLRDRRRGLLFGLGFSVPVLALLVYNQRYFGAPLEFGQVAFGRVWAEKLTGRAEVWQMQVHEGLAGLLFSPARGLFVYSPVLLLSVAGAIRIWRAPAFRALRPLTLSVVLVLLLESCFFEWWGGWSYGYRRIVDLALFLSLFLAALPPVFFSKRSLRILVAVLALWSVSLQGLGAFVYDLDGWNNRHVYVLEVPGGERIETDDADELRALEERGARRLSERWLDINKPAYRHRLWSLEDNPVFYYLTHWRQAGASRESLIRDGIEFPAG